MYFRHACTVVSAARLGLLFGHTVVLAARLGLIIESIHGHAAKKDKTHIMLSIYQTRLSVTTIVNEPCFRTANVEYYSSIVMLSQVHPNKLARAAWYLTVNYNRYRSEIQPIPRLEPLNWTLSDD